MILVDKNECVGADLERSTFQGRCCMLKVWPCDSSALQELVLFPSHGVLQNPTPELLWMFLCIFLVWPVEQRSSTCPFWHCEFQGELRCLSPTLWEPSRRTLAPHGLPQTLLQPSGDFLSVLLPLLRYRA